MKVTYLGTGAAEGIPALFCNCEYCKGVKKRGGKEVRSRAQVIVDGELSIDFPPDAFYHGGVLGADLSRIRTWIIFMRTILFCAAINTRGEWDRLRLIFTGMKKREKYFPSARKGN